jgi:hypothetical protein
MLSRLLFMLMPSTVLMAAEHINERLLLLLSLVHKISWVKLVNRPIEPMVDCLCPLQKLDDITDDKTFPFEVKAISPCYVAASRGDGEPELKMGQSVNWPVNRVALQALACPGGLVVEANAMPKAWEAWQRAVAEAAAKDGA